MCLYYYYILSAILCMLVLYITNNKPVYASNVLSGIPYPLLLPAVVLH